MPPTQTHVTVNSSVRCTFPRLFIMLHSCLCHQVLANADVLSELWTDSGSKYAESTAIHCVVLDWLTEWLKGWRMDAPCSPHSVFVYSLSLFRQTSCMCSIGSDMYQVYRLLPKYIIVIIIIFYFCSQYYYWLYWQYLSTVLFHMFYMFFDVLDVIEVFNFYFKCGLFVFLQFVCTILHNK